MVIWAREEQDAWKQIGSETIFYFLKSVNIGRFKKY